MQWYQNQRKEEQPFSCPCCRKKIDHLFDARTGSIFSKVRWSSYGLGNKC